PSMADGLRVPIACQIAAIATRGSQRTAEAEPEHPRVEKIKRLAAELAGADGRALVGEIVAFQGKRIPVETIAQRGGKRGVSVHRHGVLFVEMAAADVIHDQGRIEALLRRVEKTR